MSRVCVLSAQSRIGLRWSRQNDAKSNGGVADDNGNLGQRSLDVLTVLCQQDISLPFFRLKIKKRQLHYSYTIKS